MIFTVACSPKLNKRDFSSPLMDLKPELEENKNFEKLLQSPTNFNISWNGQVKMAEVHNAISDLIELGEQTKNEKIKQSGLKLYRKLYQEDVAVKSAFVKTPYMMYFKEISTPEVKSSLKDLDKTLDKNLAAIRQSLAKVKQSIQWPIKSKYEQSIQLLQEFLDKFLLEVENLNLSNLVSEELKTQVNEERKLNLDILQRYLEKIRSLETLENMLNVIEKMIVEFEIVLDKPTQEKLLKGRSLSEDIKKVQDEMTSLKAIISIWGFLDEAERIEYIQPISGALYSYLSSKNKEELKCLTEDKCPGLFAGLVRDWGVLPQIKKFGVEEIKKTLDKKTHSYALQILEENLLKTIKNLDQRVFIKVQASIGKGKKEISKINGNTAGFINDKVNAWIKVNFDTSESPINSYDYENIKIQMQRGSSNLSPGKNETQSVDSMAIGTSFRTSSLIWKNNLLQEKEFKRNVLEQINKIMGFGGLPSDKGPTSGIVIDFDGNKDVYDVNKAITSLVSFGLVDRVQLKSPYEAVARANQAMNVSAINQASLINGLVYLMDFFKDWEENSFDKLLGNVKSSEIFQTESDPQKDKNIFPKTQFFGLVVAQLANIVSNLNKQFSQVALLTNEAEKVWINEFLKNKDKKVLYGVYVDIINGSRGDEVSIDSIYELVQSLRKLMQVAVGIEKTKFPELQKKDLSQPECQNPKSADCKTYAQLMAENIHQLKKIFLPIGNTLATKFRRAKDQDAAGAVYSRISIRDLNPLAAEYSLDDQFKLIESLVYIYEITGLETYLWSAKETFIFLQKYYNPKTNFFDLNSKEITLPNVLAAVKAFKAIHKYLDDKEKIILEEKFKVWQYALERIN